MILLKTVSHYNKTVSLNAERKTVTTYAFNKAFLSDLQPASLASCQRNGWGVSDLDSNSKILFCDNIYSSGIQFDDIIKFGNSEFLVKGINVWDTLGSSTDHTEMLLKPVQGQKYT